MSTYRIDQHEVHVLIKTEPVLETLSVSALQENIVLNNTGSAVLASSLQENIVLNNTGSAVLASSLIINVIVRVLPPRSYTYIID